jgi:mevalonate kinase
MAVGLYSKSTVELREDHAICVKSSLLRSSNSFTGDESASALEPVRRVAEAALNYVRGGSVGLNVEINSQIPVGVGLGSSAAVAVSTIAAIAKLFNVELKKDEIRELAFVSEKCIHGKPSGIDQTTSTYGGIILYKPGEGFTPVKAGEDLTIVVGNTGKARSTGELVKKVRGLMSKRKRFAAAMIESATQISYKALNAIERGNLTELGELMNRNHNLLLKIGVSSEELNKLVEAARSAGALGAKLTGAGGGGCMIALTTKRNREAVADAIRAAGGESYILKMDEQGVRAWLEN